MTYDEKVRWLHRYQDSLRREQELAEEVEQLRSRACRVTPSLSGMPGGTSDGQALPRAVEQILEAQQELQAQIEQCNAIRREVVDAIEQITNPRDKGILQRRYLLGKKFEAIAEEFNMDSRWIRKLHKKAIVKILSELHSGDLQKSSPRKPSK